MARKRLVATEGFRVVNTRTGETGTIMNVHTVSKGYDPNYTVLPDAGPRAGVLWTSEETEWSEPTGGSGCPRCGGEHGVIQCPYGHVGAHLSAAARERLTALGLDYRRTPGEPDDPDEFDGIRLVGGVASRRTGDIFALMRRRICAEGTLIIDGHDFRAGRCKHCDESETP